MPRTPGLLLILVFVAQLLPLWPLPQEVAAKRIQFWSETKAYWDGIDPSKSDTPDWTAKAKAASLAQINKALGDTDGIVFGARLEWALSLLSAVVALSAGLAALRALPQWRWASIAALVLFLFVQQPWHFYRFFMLEGRIDLLAGLNQLALVAKDFPDVFGTMVLFSVVLPIVMGGVVGYAMLQLVRGERNAL